MYKNNFSLQIIHVNQMGNKPTHMVEKSCSCIHVYNQGDPVE